MKPARSLIGGAATVAVLAVGLSVAVAVPADAAPAAAPSWSDVEAAKASQAATQAKVDALTKDLTTLQDQADQASVAEQQAGQTYSLAASKQQDAQTKVDDLDAQAKRAKQQADDSAGQVAALVVQLSRTGGGDLTTTLLTDAKDSKDLLYRVGTMSHLSSQSAAVLARAEADQKQVEALDAQATDANAALATATATAKSALADANAAASAAQSRVQDEQDQQSTLYSQLAYLKGTTASTEEAYFADQQAKAAAAAIAASATKSAPTKSSTTTNTGTGTKTTTGGSTGTTGGSSTGTTAGSGTGSTGTTGGGTTAPVTTPSQPSQPTQPSAPVSTPSKGAAALAFATSQIGKPYLFGGAGPSAYDCSGLVMASYASVGVAVGGHNVVWQYDYFASLGRLVPLSQAQPGDIMFYSTNGSVSGEYHDTIYAGGGRMVEAPKPGVAVRNIAVWTPSQLMPYVARPTGSL